MSAALPCVTPNVALLVCSLQQETTAGPACQEECGEVRQKNALQEPPLPPTGIKRSEQINQLYCSNKKNVMCDLPLLPVLDHACQEARIGQGRFLLRSIPRSQSGGIDGRRQRITCFCRSCRRRSVQSHVRPRGLKDKQTSAKINKYFCDMGLR